MNEMNNVEYIELSADDVARVAAPSLSASERRLLARSNIPGTELYRESSGMGSHQEARVALTMAMAQVGGFKGIDVKR
jgi:hypothetical protein